MINSYNEGTPVTPRPDSKPAPEKVKFPTYPMGEANYDINRTMALADALEDEEIIKNLFRA